MAKVFTKEEVRRNTHIINEKLKEVRKLANDHNLFYVALFHYDPLTDSIDNRIGYFEERFEANNFAEDLHKTYERFSDTPFTIYQN